MLTDRFVSGDDRRDLLASLQFGEALPPAIVTVRPSGLRFFLCAQRKSSADNVLRVKEMECNGMETNDWID
jgi:hypothetical protein